LAKHGNYHGKGRVTFGQGRATIMIVVKAGESWAKVR